MKQQCNRSPPFCSATAGSPSCRDSRTGWPGCCGRPHQSRPSSYAWGHPLVCPPSNPVSIPAGSSTQLKSTVTRFLFSVFFCTLIKHTNIWRGVHVRATRWLTLKCLPCLTRQSADTLLSYYQIRIKMTLLIPACFSLVAPSQILRNKWMLWLPM